MASIWVSQPGTICNSKTWLLLVFIPLLQGPLCVESSPISNTHQRYRPAPGLGDGHGGVVDPSMLEQDSNMDMQSLLESLKEQFLRTFNLSGMGPPPLPDGSTREEPPEYMVELYNRFANDRTAMPTANIIRSFKNEVKPSVYHFRSGGVRRHLLLFNVSIPHHERVTAAELRLYTLVQTDRHLYAGVDQETERIELVELASRQVYGTDNGWEAFDLTAAVQRWRKSDHGTTHQLEVHIASGDMKIDISPEEKHKPLLIVFSDDQSNEEDLIQMRSNLIYDTASRIRRNAKGNHCKKQSLYVEFKDIGWDSWILAPTGYDAFECTGICSFPLTKHVTPTKHAIVQTLININSPQKAARACCVPTKLDPISLLYLDDTGVVTYKYKFEGMVVAECGCR
uniref:Bone morphogenetic protein 10 n=1 Tax=Sphaeramia orbicularis TaxID=375764 RepID=A0A673AD83_9TELE